MSDTQSIMPKSDTIARKTDRVADAVKQTAENAAAGVKQMQDTARTGMQKVSELARGYADVQRGTIETGAEAAKIYGQGLQDLVKHAAEISRVQIEDSMAHLRALSGVKSVTDLLHLQAEFARTTTSRALTESSNFVEQYLKVATSALAPVTAKAREAAAKVKQAA